jgi:dihydroorotase
MLTDEACANYDTNYKMNPPLRSGADQAALREALADGTIDAIATDHAPHALFEKEVEYTAAPFGIIGLETCWGLVGRELIRPGVLDVRDAVYKLAVAPREILGLPVPVLEEGAEANLTVFDAETVWTFESRHIHSKSHNTPFVGAEMVGRAWGVYNRGRLVVSEQ